MSFKESICNISLTSAGYGDFAITFRKSEFSRIYFSWNIPNFSDTYFKKDKRRRFHAYAAWLLLLHGVINKDVCILSRLGI